MIDEWRICTSTIVAKLISEDTVAAPRISSKLITFLDLRGKALSDSSQDKAYTIEPEKQATTEPINSSTEGEDSSGYVPIEPTNMSAIPEHKSTDKTNKPEIQDDSTD